MSNYTDDQLEEIEFAIKTSSDVFGNEIFKYDSEDEREAGLSRLSSKIEKLQDGIDREIYYIDHGDEELVAEWDGEEWMSHIQKEKPSLQF